MKNLPYKLMFIVVILCSCTYNNIYINRAADNNDGQKVVKKIYDEIAAKSFEHLDTMMSDSLKKLAGPNAISKLAGYINKKVGNYKSYVLDDSYIRSIVGSDNNISYNYKLRVTYDKGVIQEIIGLSKINGSAIKITAYRANSDLLMK